jgi:CheY-like chemotaxis protein
MEILDTAVESSRPLIQSKQHQLAILAPTRRIELEADPVRLTQVITNLLTNAAKYTDAHGDLVVGVELETSELMIFVRDNGIGIAPAMLPRIFEMFLQESGTAHRAEGGLGIGLALVRAIVELHGGKIEAKSAGLGRGSEFRIRLPLTAIQRTTQATLDASARQRVPKQRVLIADDNRDAAEILALLLEAAGHEVHCSHSGHEALDLATRERPDVLVLDIGMPGMDGYEVAERVRRQGWAADALLIAVTGWGQERDKQHAAESGFDYHLTKPVDFAHLEALLSKAAQRSGLREQRR